MFSEKIQTVMDMKNKRLITMLTCYDYSFAGILSGADIDILLVGDSMANVVLGREKTKSIQFSEMIEHTRAVVKGAGQTLVIADMPYISYQKNPSEAVGYARELIDETGAGGVKIEWFSRCPEVAGDLVSSGIAVMGHIGLTPQTVDELGGFRIQGKTSGAARRLMEQAELLDRAGVFGIVLECVPEEIARLITAGVKVPTIGIGAGRYCDGQVLVLYDFLGLYPGRKPRFAKQYMDGQGMIRKAADDFAAQVRKREFPGPAESFGIDPAELEELKKKLSGKDGF